MKKLFFCLTAVSVLAIAISSCTATKRDCQGRMHYKQKGGFYL